MDKERKEHLSVYRFYTMYTEQNNQLSHQELQEHLAVLEESIAPLTLY